MGSVNYVVLSGAVVGEPKDCNSASGFPTVKLHVDLVGRRRIKNGVTVGDSLVVPVYFYGKAAEYVMSCVYPEDMVIVEARLKRDGRGPKEGEPWLQLGGRSIRVIPGRGDARDVMDQSFDDGPMGPPYPMNGPDYDE